MNEKRPLYSLIIPTLATDGLDQIKTQCDEILTFSQSMGLHLELIFIANPKSLLSQQDRSSLLKGVTVEIASSKLSEAKRFLTGLKKSSGTWSVFLDSRRSVPLSELINCMGYFEADPNCKIVLGERNHKSQNALVGRPDFWEELIENSLKDAFHQNFTENEIDPRCPFVAIHFSLKDEILKSSICESLFLFAELKIISKLYSWPSIRHPIRWVFRKKSFFTLFKEMLNSFKDLSLLKSNYGKKANLNS